MAIKQIPYCVDVDGTYLKTDLSFETLLIFIKLNLFRVFLLPFILLKGRASAKAHFVKSAMWHLTIEKLPRNADLVEFLNEKKAEGHDIYLVSASNEHLIKAIVENDNIFVGGYGSTEHINLKGSTKADFLEKTFPEGFIYVGDSKADLLVWKKAKQAVVVNASNAVIAKAKKLTEVVKIFPKPSFANQIKPWVKQLRFYQWIKNLLVFIPMALVHYLDDIDSWITVASGFVLLSILASATYILNDLIDMNDDRAHWSKSTRPLASGAIWPMNAFKVFIILLLFSLFWAFYLSLEFGYGLVAYLVITISYSFYLKRIALLDVLTLAGLFTLRIVLGALLMEVDNSVWLLSFSFFFFISLAIVKRVTELQKSSQQPENENFGRAYQVRDIQFLNSFGIATAICSVVLMQFYMIDQQYNGKGYGHPKLLWIIPVCIFLSIARIWMQTIRGEMSDDPIIFAITDRFCQILVVISVIIFFIAGSVI